jgi:hypothetical protein
VAGKTGTAQKTIAGVKGFAPGKYVSSFVGMAPARDPEIVCLVVIDEPEGRGLGGEVAAPAFSRIVERIVRGPAREVVVRPGGRRSDGPADLMRGPDAVTATRDGSEGAPLTVAAGTGEGTSPAGLVLADGRNLADRRAVAAPAEGGILVEPFTEADSVTVPDLSGMSIRRARRVACAAGLVLSSEGSGRVRSQSPRPGGTVPSGHRVVVTCYPG